MPEGQPIADDFDILGRRFAEALVDLFPGIEIISRPVSGRGRGPVPDLPKCVSR